MPEFRARRGLNRPFRFFFCLELLTVTVFFFGCRDFVKTLAGRFCCLVIRHYTGTALAPACLGRLWPEFVYIYIYIYVCVLSLFPFASLLCKMHCKTMLGTPEGTRIHAEKSSSRRLNGNRTPSSLSQKALELAGVFLVLVLLSSGFLSRKKYNKKISQRRLGG